MPPKYIAKKCSVSTSTCRRSRRIADRIKCMVKGQSASLKEQPSSTKVRRKLPNRKKSGAKKKPASSKGQPSSTTESGKPLSTTESGKPLSTTESGKPLSTTESGKPSYTEKSEAKTQPASSKGLSSSTIESEKPSCSKKTVTKRKSQPTSVKKSTVKKRRVVEKDEIKEMGQELEDFSSCIEFILGELCTDLTISEEAIAEMNIYLNHVFARLAMESAIQQMKRNDKSMSVKDIESAVVLVVGGELSKYCICEGRRAVKKCNKVLYKALYSVV